MNAMMDDCHFPTLADKGLLTLVKEIKFILNCRPLTRVSADPEDFRALSP